MNASKLRLDFPIPPPPPPSVAACRPSRRSFWRLGHRDLSILPASPQAAGTHTVLSVLYKHYYCAVKFMRLSRVR